MTPSIYIKDGKRAEGHDATVYGGDITDTTARMSASSLTTAWLAAFTPKALGTDFTVEGAVTSLSGDGQGLGENPPVPVYPATQSSH